MNEGDMLPENRKGPRLSDVKRANAALKRQIRKQEAVVLAVAYNKLLTDQLQDLKDFNAHRIDGPIETFVPKLVDAIVKARIEEKKARGDFDYG